MLHRRDETVEQLIGGHALAAKIIHQEHAAVGLEVRRGLVVAQRGAVDQIEKFEREFAADDDQGAPDPHPALIDGAGLVALDFDALMDLLVKQPNHAVTHADAIRNPVIARKCRVNLSSEAAFAVAGRPVDKQAASGGNRQAGQLHGFWRQDQAR